MKLPVEPSLYRQPVVKLSPRDIPAAKIDALYVHIPFCFHKCHYCDFYSITRQTPQRMDRFVDLILQEASLWDQSSQPQTIFFGGGTPSLLPLEAMQKLILGLKKRFDLSQVNEWTIEVNPATANLDYLQMLRSLGVNRLSFGAQSFNIDELKTLERHHNPDDVESSLSMARLAGFERLNVDLIYAIPGQTLQSWDRSLTRAINLGTTHLSCYGLTYEPNTVISVRKRLGQIIESPEELELEMFTHTRSVLQSHGIEWYEISNYATIGEECRHNLNYWRGKNYIGIGPSAASHVDGHRFKNRPHLGEWESAVPTGDLPVIEHELLSPDQRLRENIMLQLRLREGVNWKSLNLQSEISNPFKSTIDHLHSLGLIEVTPLGFHLTEKGMNLADAVAGEFAD